MIFFKIWNFFFQIAFSRDGLLKSRADFFTLNLAIFF